MQCCLLEYLFALFYQFQLFVALIYLTTVACTVTLLYSLKYCSWSSLIVVLPMFFTLPTENWTSECSTLVQLLSTTSSLFLAYSTGFDSWLMLQEFHWHSKIRAVAFDVCRSLRCQLLSVSSLVITIKLMH